jgi:hypothetical protein
MKKLFSLSFVGFVIVVSSLQVSVSSCKKDTVTVRDTIEIIDFDTVQVSSVDTVFSMNVNNWNGFSYQTTAAVTSGASTYSNNADGLLLKAQASHLGLRCLTKNEMGIKDKTMYFKWKANGGGDFSAFVFQLKYDPTKTDSDPPVQNVDFVAFSTKNAISYTTLISNDTWYYTRIRAVPGTDKYQSITATGNYDNSGGTILVTKEVNVYTKHGFLGFRIGDPFSINATMTVAEARIASN